MTGVEAISNGVPAFKPPEWVHARTTLMWMGSLLGVMFLGLSFLALKLHALPTETETLNSADRESGLRLRGRRHGPVSSSSSSARC